MTSSVILRHFRKKVLMRWTLSVKFTIGSLSELHLTIKVAVGRGGSSGDEGSGIFCKMPLFAKKPQPLVVKLRYNLYVTCMSGTMSGGVCWTLSTQGITPLLRLVTSVLRLKGGLWKLNSDQRGVFPLGGGSAVKQRRGLGSPWEGPPKGLNFPSR